MASHIYMYIYICIYIKSIRNGKRDFVYEFDLTINRTTKRPGALFRCMNVFFCNDVFYSNREWRSVYVA